MVDVGVMTGNDRDAFQKAGLCSCAFSIRAFDTEAHHLAAFWEAFFMLEYAIAAIETEYRGIKFRSRLEARWAAFFDQCGWSWQYEPVDLNGWMPDFSIEGKCLVEVKPFERCAQWREEARKIVNAVGLTDGYLSSPVILLGACGPAANDCFGMCVGSYMTSTGKMRRYSDDRPEELFYLTEFCGGDARLDIQSFEGCSTTVGLLFGTTDISFPSHKYVFKKWANACNATRWEKT